MSLLHPVEPRLCKVCGHKWFAEAGHSRVRPGPVLFSAHQNTGLAYSRGKYEQWRHCPTCGTNKVKRVSKAGFVPTAATPPAVVVQVQPVMAPYVPVPVQSMPVPLQSMPVAPPPAAPRPAPSLNRDLPGDDLIRRAIASTRRRPLELGEHVHSAGCVEDGCTLLGQRAHDPGPKQYAQALLAVLVAVLFAWPLQYCYVTPLVGLRYATSDSRSRTWGIVGVVCGLGVFYSLAYLAMPQVPRQALTPWGTYRRSPELTDNV